MTKPLPKTLPFTAAALLAIALKEVGYTERPAGSNRTKYGKWFGMDGAAWCAMYAVWCMNQAGVDLRPHIRNEQYTPSLYTELKRIGWKEVSPEAILPGDIILFDFPDNVHRIQHVGFATEAPRLFRRLQRVLRSKSYVRTVEGNTSSSDHGSQSNGGGVFRRDRKLSYIKRVIRPPYADHAPAKKPAPGRTITALLTGAIISYGGINYLPASGPNAAKPTVTITRTVTAGPTKTVLKKQTVVKVRTVTKKVTKTKYRTKYRTKTRVVYRRAR